MFYQVAEPHPVLAGFDVGEQIVVDRASPGRSHAWFTGYEGDGRRVLAAAGRSDQGPLGPGIGVQQRERNRHVLLSLHGATPFGAGPTYWTDPAATVLVNAVRWAAPAARFECSLVSGGLVVGQATDHNTGGALNDAVVTGPDGARGVSAATPDDPGTGDGFYWLFAPATGRVELTASAHRYAVVPATVEVVAGAAVRADVALPAGALRVTPEQVRATLRPDRSTERRFTVSNTGSAPVRLELAKRHASQTSSGNRPAAAQYVPGEFSPARPPPGRADRGGAATPLAPSVTGQAGAPWTGIADYPVPITDNSAAVLDGRVYSIGGLTRDPATGQPLPESRGYVYQPVADRWHDIEELPRPRQKPAVAAIDGLVYAVGGWNAGMAPTATTFVYHPAGDRWSRGTDLPARLAAPGTAVTGGQLYLVGGCADELCSGTTTTWRYDPSTERWTELAPAGRAVYRGAGACGFYKIGGATRFTPLAGAEVHRGLDDCAAAPADLPWFDADPPATTLRPGQRVTVTVSFDPDGPAPGTYQAAIGLVHDTPYPVDPVEVTMVVREPVHCDRTITGTHSGRLQVTTGVTCVADGARITGPTTVRDGAGLMAGTASFTGPLVATGAAVVELAGTRLDGPLIVRGTTRRLWLSDTSVTGPVQLTGNIIGSTGDVPIIVAGNVVAGPLSCHRNEPAPVSEGAPNRVTGQVTGQCRNLR